VPTTTPGLDSGVSMTLVSFDQVVLENIWAFFKAWKKRINAQNLDDAVIKIS
jgi:hypothetical protein